MSDSTDAGGANQPEPTTDAATNPPADWAAGGKPTPQQRWLFIACMVSLVATSFGFMIRAMLIGTWGAEFGLDETQKGEIFGAGLWPFAISIVLFSLVIDRIGYGRALWFAFFCHVTSTIVTIFADGYWGLYVGTFIAALGNGTVEAVINPVVATMFPRAKTKWLNILHAGWPGGLVIAGLLTLAMSEDGIIGSLAEGPIAWQWKVGLVLIPTVIYGIMLVRCHFPVNERVKAGVPYKAMLAEVGFLGCVIISGMIVAELTRVAAARFEWDLVGAAYWGIVGGVTLLISVPYGLYVKAAGRPLFIFLLLLMIPLATTELGTDGWIKELMNPPMEAMGLDGGWVLVYTATIMMILRFFAGPLVHILSPLGLLAASSFIAMIGLAFLSTAAGWVILIAATVYGIGQTFFWPTTLGLVAERFPRGGALTLNAVAGVGMLGVGIIGMQLLGNIQDRTVVDELQEQAPAVYEEVAGEKKLSIFGPYRSINNDQVASLPEEQAAVVTDVRNAAKQDALFRVAIFPAFMLLCYLGLMAYFRSQGGYQAEVLTGHGAEDGKYTGGVEGPADH